MISTHKILKAAKNTIPKKLYLKNTEKKIHKEVTPTIPKNQSKLLFIVELTSGIFLLLFSFVASYYYYFEKKYENKAYPNVFIGGKNFNGFTKQQIENYWQFESKPLEKKSIELVFEDNIATVSASSLNAGYDEKLAATQALLVGRSGNILSDIWTKFFEKKVDIEKYFRYDKRVVEEILENLSYSIDKAPVNALFDFDNGKVKSFQLSQNGRKINTKDTLKAFDELLSLSSAIPEDIIKLNIVVDTIPPSITNSEANSFGITELIGTGYSEFTGSIASRIHNVQLAAKTFHGYLIKPGEIFSYNQVIGDISKATGYQQAYIIQNGRTVLGDGGGVCQVSTTIFRAALNSGLPIVERHAHAYRVHYYEEGGFKPGIDATVFSPSVDFKFKNDTNSSILIQTEIDIKNLTLKINFYGTKDGRKSEISEQKSWDSVPAPEPSYQDDPTLPQGVVKQIDFAASGLKSSFKYKVYNADGSLKEEEVFYSNYRPWQAIFLKGTGI